MPSPLTSSFASAAAGSNGENAGSRRGDNVGNNEWSRNRVNGSTQTFRRTSTHALHTRDSTQTPISSASVGAYIPPHLNTSSQSSATRNGISGEGRYSKEQLLALYQGQRDTGVLNKSLEDIFSGSWNPHDPRAAASANWNGRGEAKDTATGPEVCWDSEVANLPLGLVEMDEEEKMLFSSSVNSPLKVPQNNAKENTAGSNTVGGRKLSLSGHHPGMFSNATTSSSRPGPRRRETSESHVGNGPLSPTGLKQSYFRDEPTAATPPPALLRRRTDFKDEASQDEVRSLERNATDLTIDPEPTFASLKRSSTGPLSAGLNGPSSSPWSGGPPSSAFGSMGTFGSFAVGSSPLIHEPLEKRPGYGSGRGSSRFKDLLSKTSLEETSPSVKQKISLGNLEKLPEDEAESRQSRSNEVLKTRPYRSETNPYEDEPLPRSGSAALGGAQDTGVANRGVEHLGFAAFGLPVNVGGRDFAQRDVGPNQIYHQTPQGRQTVHEPMSPTTTNPYQSPPGNRGDDDDVITNDSESQPSAQPPFGSIRRNIVSVPEERSQSSNSITNRGHTGPGGLSGLPPLGPGSAWATGGLSSGTPVRDRTAVPSAFGDSIFSPMSDLQSSNMGGLSGNSFFGAGAFGNASSIGRGSKLGAMFPPAMQEQMRGENTRGDAPGNPVGFEPKHDSFQISSRDPFESSTRRREDAMQRGNFFEDGSLARGGAEESQLPFGPQSVLGQPSAIGTSQTPATGPDLTQRNPTASENTPSVGHGLSQSSGSSGSNQLPAAQQRQMVMPDRMRWIYRDPQGNTQGPWSGLEMHDWFKAGFFTAELQVKKLEDTEYEPLAQLVRRIGNSREPFLVPQIGVPHGPASSSQGNHWASPTIPGVAAAQPGNAQPPFASSFPSFGTTLTAEQQNALERRKQEEQFLMARQKEHLAQQQVIMKQMQLQGGPHAMHSLQHHSSAHSLHSQPSFGSITSPSAYQPSSMQDLSRQTQHAPGFLDSMLRQPPTSNMTHPTAGGDRREDELHGLFDRTSFNQRSSFPPGSGPLGSPQQDAFTSSNNLTSVLQDRSRLQAEQQQHDMRNHQDTFLGQGGENDRLAEFDTLRSQEEPDQGQETSDGHALPPIGAPRSSEAQSSRHRPPPAFGPVGQQSSVGKAFISEADAEGLSLTQVVQRAAASYKQEPDGVPESPWNKMERNSAIAAPPPLSISPLPAPAAQRNRQHVADALAAESSSASQTPIETSSASVAPWAEKTSENTKGPSLKEIQEAEARKAAELEALAAIARRAQAEQERVTMPIPPAPGLPASSTWGNNISPATPTGPVSSVWVKGSAGKPAAAPSGGKSKKTLAQIQQEEESRKQRAAAAVSSAQAAAANVMATAAAGKRYAELASKIAPATPAAPPTAWTTVGSSGKAKAPATVVATPQAAAAVRTPSNAATSAKARPALQTSRSITSANQGKAADEFTKWTKGALGKGLNNSINLDDFVQSLLALPAEADIISDSVYANSQTLDGRRFAEEFIRRRKLADKGLIDPASGATAQSATAENKSGGGWSEVAKKGPAPKEESTAPFKVVSKKKGKR